MRHLAKLLLVALALLVVMSPGTAPRSRTSWCRPRPSRPASI